MTQHFEKKDATPTLVHEGSAAGGSLRTFLFVCFNLIRFFESNIRIFPFFVKEWKAILTNCKCSRRDECDAKLEEQQVKCMS